MCVLLQSGIVFNPYFNRYVANWPWKRKQQIKWQTFSAGCLFAWPTNWSLHRRPLSRRIYMQHHCKCEHSHFLYQSFFPSFLPYFFPSFLPTFFPCLLLISMYWTYIFKKRLSKCRSVRLSVRGIKRLSGQRVQWVLLRIYCDLLGPHERSEIEKENDYKFNLSS